MEYSGHYGVVMTCAEFADSLPRLSTLVPPLSIYTAWKLLSLFIPQLSHL